MGPVILALREGSYGSPGISGGSARTKCSNRVTYKPAQLPDLLALKMRYTPSCAVRKAWSRTACVRGCKGQKGIAEQAKVKSGPRYAAVRKREKVGSAQRLCATCGQTPSSPE